MKTYLPGCNVIFWFSSENMKRLPNRELMSSPEAVIRIILKFAGVKSSDGSLHLYFISLSPCYRTEIANAYLLKSIGLVSVNEKKAWGMGLSSSVPKL